MDMTMIVGSLNVDLTVVVERFARPGETVHGHDFQRVCGGKGMNQAVAAARLGGNVTLVGKVGSDSDGDWLRKQAIAEGMNLCVGTSTQASGVALIAVDEAGENQIIVSKGANWTLSEKETIDAIAQVEPRYVSFVLEVPLETVMAGAKAAHDAGAVVLLNPSPLREIPDDLVSNVDILIVNEEELRGLLGPGEGDLYPRAIAYAGQHQVQLVVTRGARGAAVVNAHHCEEIAGVKVNAVDTTGCGDAFTGALMYYLSQSLLIGDAVAKACVVAGYAATIRGAQPSYPTQNQLAGMAAGESV